MQRVSWILGLVLGLTLALAVLATVSPAQVIVGEIDLDDGDPDLVPDSPFGEVVTPDGRFLLVCISGDPDFDPNPPQLNNNQVRVIDRSTGTVANTITTGFFPVECAVTSHGSDAYLYVADSTDGTVSVFRAEGGAFDDPARITQAPGSPIDLGLFSFPNGVTATPDQASVYVSTAGGSGEIHRIDADPASPTFDTVVETIVVSGAVNRMAVHGGDLVATQSVFDPTFTLSTARVTILNMANPADRSEIVLTPEMDFGLGELASAIDVAVRPDGQAFVTVFGTGTGTNLFVLDVPGRTIARTVNLEAAGSENLHGVGISPDGRFAAVTLLDAGRLAILDLETDSLAAILETPAGPNEAVWSHDGSRLYVTNQGAHSVSVVGGFSGRDLVLGGTTTPPLGGEILLSVRGGTEGASGGVLVSETGQSGGTFHGFPVPLSDPVSLLERGTFDVEGRFAPSPVPIAGDPSLVGKTIYYLAGARDEPGGGGGGGGGAVRFSNILTVVIQP